MSGFDVLHVLGETLRRVLLPLLDRRRFSRLVLLLGARTGAAADQWMKANYELTLPAWRPCIASGWPQLAGA